MTEIILVVFLTLAACGEPDTPPITTEIPTGQFPAHLNWWV